MATVLSVSSFFSPHFRRGLLHLAASSLAQHMNPVAASFDLFFLSRKLAEKWSIRTIVWWWWWWWWWWCYWWWWWWWCVCVCVCACTAMLTDVNWSLMMLLDVGCCLPVRDKTSSCDVHNIQMIQLSSVLLLIIRRQLNWLRHWRGPANGGNVCVRACVCVCMGLCVRVHARTRGAWDKRCCCVLFRKIE